MWDPNDPDGPHGLYTVQREREEQARRQTAESENVWRRHVAWTADYIKEQNRKSNVGHSTWPDYSGGRQW